MADGVKASQGARVTGLVLGALCLLLWFIVVAPMADLGSSDPAGNAMAQGFAAIGIILLWGLLSILALVAAINGAMPSWARAALIVVPASGLAAMATLNLLGHPGTPPYRWPIIAPALIPPFVVAYCIWTLVAGQRTTMLANLAAGIALGAVLALSVAIMPMQTIRSTTIAQEERTRANLRAEFERLPGDAPLWAFVPFLEARDQTIVRDVLERIRTLSRRQGDAETMLARGDFPLGYLAQFDLDPTPATCEKARVLLNQRVTPLIPKVPGAKPYTTVAEEVAGALSAMSWLVGYGCACDAESRAWEDMAKAYQNPNFDVVDLGRLREPGRLGKKLREDPDKFSMLGPRSHLKGWLKFGYNEEMRAKIAAGVRTVESRTADAVEILTDKYQESSRFQVLRVLPVLDAEATPRLCAAAATEIGKELRSVYRPKPDDPPLPYRDLVERLGVGRPMTALIWLGEQRCDVAAELRDADALVRTYQDLPPRAAMLAAIARLQAPR